MTKETRKIVDLMEDEFGCAVSNSIEWAEGLKIKSIEIESAQIENDRGDDPANIGLSICFADSEDVLFIKDLDDRLSNRYMVCCDDLEHFFGAEFRSAEVRLGPTVTEPLEGVNESEFLIINTSLGQITCVNYNEHNGYYGGFEVRAYRLCPVKLKK